MSLKEYIKNNYKNPNLCILKQLGASDELIEYLRITPWNTNLNIIIANFLESKKEYTFETIIDVENISVNETKRPIMFSNSKGITDAGPVIKVTINNDTYTIPQHSASSESDAFYGWDGVNKDFSEYPILIIFNAQVIGGYVSEPGTYSIKIEISKEE